jgi:crotonobetainyl-CoA:carnitine CoA-transferase CaiB-like acyl-CoA transferase
VSEASAAPARRLPLRGVRILAVSQFGAGPFATSLLADLGAEVIKIEDPKSDGDSARAVPPQTIAEGDTLYFQSFNRNKKSLALDLESERGRAVFRRLVPGARAVYNNLRGDLPERLGLTYAELGRLNPAIVCCSLSGFGQTGPRRAEPGYDNLVQALAGYMSLTGEPDGPPTKCGVSVIDFAGGYASLIGLMVALFDAERTGIGRDVDVSLFDTALHMLSYLAIWYLNDDFQPGRTADSGHYVLVPAQNFATADGTVAVICFKEKFWERLCERIGREDLAREPRFRRFPDRLEHKEELVAILKPVFAARPTAYWIELLTGHVPCAPVNDLAAGLAEPQVAAREMIVEIEHPRRGTIREVGSPIKLSGEPMPLRPAPALGADTEELLREAGFTDAEIAELERSGVVLSKARVGT